MFSALIYYQFGLDRLQMNKTWSKVRVQSHDYEATLKLLLLSFYCAQMNVSLWVTQEHRLYQIAVIFNGYPTVKILFKVCCIKKNREGKGHSEAAPSGCDIHSVRILKIKKIYIFQAQAQSLLVRSQISPSLCFMWPGPQKESPFLCLFPAFQLLLFPPSVTACLFSSFPLHCASFFWPRPSLVGWKLLSRLVFDPDGAQLD